jgi:hypothetical protein
MELPAPTAVKASICRRREIVKQPATPDRPQPHPRNDAPPSPTRRSDGDEDLDDALDEALKETFPASDPIAVSKKKKRKD